MNTLDLRMVPKSMLDALHVELDNALANICRKLDAAAGQIPASIELELVYPRSLKEGDLSVIVHYFYVAEVSQSGRVDSSCDGQTLYINGEKFDI